MASLIKCGPEEKTISLSYLNLQSFFFKLI